MSNTIKIVCKRCGQCCGSGGPALHGKDRKLLAAPAVLDLTDLFTVRAGERVRNQPAGRIEVLAEEVVKIAPVPGGRTCRFYNDPDQACSIYDDRPAECRVMFCRDTSALEAMYEKDRLSRKDLLPDGHPLLTLIEEHDKACDPAELDRLARLVLDDDAKAKDEISAMLAYDEAVRDAAVEKAGLPKAALPFLFGRPLADILVGLGVAVRRDGDRLVLSKNPLTA